jgi:hypothetical protein
MCSRVISVALHSYLRNEVNLGCIDLLAADKWKDACDRGAGLMIIVKTISKARNKEHNAISTSDDRSCAVRRFYNAGQTSVIEALA